MSGCQTLSYTDCHSLVVVVSATTYLVVEPVHDSSATEALLGQLPDSFI